MLPGWLLACATAPVPVAAPTISVEPRLASILRLEDQRVLRDPIQPPTATLTAPGVRASAASRAPVGDLTRLLTDADPRVRRRAALAIGRVGLRAGARPLGVALSTDPQPEVRQMAAFALGLLGEPSVAEILRAALRDPSPVVQGRAAEALGAIGDQASAVAIGELVSAQVRAGVLASVSPDDMAETHLPRVDAFRLGVFALGRLKAYEALAGAVLDRSGRPLVGWWPVASALQRTEDRRALGPLLVFARGESRFGRAFAARGLGTLKDVSAVDTLLWLVGEWPRDPLPAISAVRALAQIGDRRAGPVLLRLLETRGLDPLLQLEAVTAIGRTGNAAAMDPLLDLVSHPSPAIRRAALTSLKELDAPTFLFVLSGLDADRHWSVRAAVAALLGSLDQAAGLPRLVPMLKDRDVRVIPSVLAALVKLKAPTADQTLLEWLKHEDVVVRAAAAAGLGELKPPGGDRALVAAFHAAERDEAYAARTAALDALVRYGAAAAVPTLHEALADSSWAVRFHAAALLKPLEPGADPAAMIRPAPTRRAAAAYGAPELVAPTVSPHVFIETDRGTIEVEMAVLDAPLTCDNFMTLARRGFFNGSPLHRVVPNFVVQGGDPRGDGEGGPGYAIRDEINERPYLRGTMGMALEWADTGGSQFFLTHSPQPHLDGRYTVFGRIVAGFEVLDRLQPWDTIVAVRVWDGRSMAGQ